MRSGKEEQTKVTAARRTARVSRGRVNSKSKSQDNDDTSKRKSTGGTARKSNRKSKGESKRKSKIKRKSKGERKGECKTGVDLTQKKMKSDGGNPSKKTRNGGGKQSRKTRGGQGKAAGRTGGRTEAASSTGE